MTLNIVQQIAKQLIPSKRMLSSLIMAAVLLVWSVQTAQTASRVKDIAEFEGIRDNILVGYGLVVGLNGTGDSLSNSPFTEQSLESMLERLGVNTSGETIKTDNTAAVIVTATLPPFQRQGTKIDIVVSSLGDAADLTGGTLIVTPLMAADGEIYAVAQGTVTVAGYTAGGEAETVTKGVPTTARIANGAIVERELGFDLAALTSLRISLRNPDLTTSRRIAQAVNEYIGNQVAESADPSTVVLNLEGSKRDNMVDLLADIEQLMVDPDQIARVVIDEQSGIIVIGKEVKVDTVAIAQGNLTVRITETPQVSQPGPFSENGETVVVDRTDVQVSEDDDRKLTVLNKAVSLQDLVDGLNALGIGPRDMISILQAIKAAGALQAEIELM
ncbi:flagellar basal body P-ring protein FlgI [Sneathiella marina]|uniref:Flagellar P-ring protein n=1 Tax=Sneathiella marina TaxID=2950108 RepID=A0ABY4VY37_9PROT|nr:flagellar basal body P-ring protein FlgI [Sneathiella marina]USG59840.1 flagellar basal body P-ring protein FlgI [Sneathiella marina]